MQAGILSPVPSLQVERAQNGVITSCYDITVDRRREVCVFTDPDAFAEYMRAWFVSHHGEKPVTQLPKAKGFDPNGEG